MKRGTIIIVIVLLLAGAAFFSSRSFSLAGVPTIEKEFGDASIDYDNVVGLQVSGSRECFDQAICDNTVFLMIDGREFDAYGGGHCIADANGQPVQTTDAFGKEYAVSGSLIKGKHAQLTNACGSILTQSLVVQEQVECVVDADCGQTQFARLTRTAGGVCDVQTHFCKYDVQVAKDANTSSLIVFGMIILIVGGGLWWRKKR